MRAILLLLLLAAPVHAATVEELFAKSRKAVETANGIAFDFEYRAGEIVHRGRGAVKPNGEMLIEMPQRIIWSDGSSVEMLDKPAKVAWHTAMHRAGRLLIARHLHGIPDAFASATRFEDTLVY